MKKIRRSSVSTESLLWVMGLFCGFIGAFLLVAPHHFQTIPYRALLPYSLAWGTLATVSGVGLLAVAVLRPRRWITVSLHATAALTLLALAFSFAIVKAVTGAGIYTLLGLGTLLAAFIPRDEPGAGGKSDLFALLMGLGASFFGVLILVFPRVMQGAFYGPYRYLLPWLAAGFLLTGPLLLRAELGPRRGRLWRQQALAGLAFFAFGAVISIPGRLWTGAALYCGGGLALALLPAVRRGLARLDTAALRIRLALALASATSLALISAVAMVTAQEERLGEQQVLQIQRIEARAIAQNVADYIDMNGARAFGLAALAGRVPLTTEVQRGLLAASQKSDPDVAALGVTTAEGLMVANVGQVPLPLRTLRGMAGEMGGETPSRIQLRRVQVGARSLLLLAAPVPRGQDPMDGMLVAAYDTAALARRIARPGSRVSLADGHGVLVAFRDELPAEATGLPELPPRWDRDIRAGRRVSPERGVAGFAVVPRLRWVVAVETPRSVALAGVRQGRDLAFGLLLVVVPLAVLGGVAVARRIARPLGQLSEAVDALTAGDLAAPVSSGAGITEVARLAAAFREMRDRLAERTRESERLAAELRARAEALAETDRRKDEFLAMLAHELRNPLGAIANSSYLLEQLGSDQPQKARAIEIIRRQIQHLVRMVDDLLDVSRITRGKVDLRREPVDLAEVVRGAVEVTRPLADAKEQKLTLALDREPLPMDGDATRLEQVLSNLLRNAVKFTDPGGRIDVAAWRDDGQAVVRVRDDGIGMAPELLPRVFDLFAQGEQALDRSGAGLGIGLTLVRRLVEMHGGTVEARSEGVGKGSEFEVRLPLAPLSTN